MRYLKIIILSIVFIAIGFWVATQINKELVIQYKEKTSIEFEPPVTLIKDSSKATRNYGLRIIDLGGVGILPDSANWGSNYEHNTHRFEDMILSQSPFIDTVAFARIEKEFLQFVSRAKNFNYNGIIIHGYGEFVNFDKLGNGYEVYPANGEYRERHLAFRNYFGRLMEHAHNNGLKVYASTDMTTYTTPLRNYMLKTLGKIDTEDPELWKIYQAGAAELFETMPGVDGFLLRIGEAGTVYNRKGWDYYSELEVTTDKAVQLMLRSFLDVAEKYNKLIIFRTWSVGVGQVGDMHTNPETYSRVFESINSSNLVLSTKYCSGDFYSWLPFNPTLSVGKHRRITEFQCRREYEGMNAFPNYLGPLHQQVLQRFATENENFDGFWQWSQEGGPLRAGPLSIYPFHGFNVITDANVFVTAKLAQNPFADMKGITAEWIRFYFGEDSLLTANLTEMLLMSHDVTRQGLYITEFAKYDVRALGLEPPPMMWIFEWDMVGASSSALGSIYYVCKPNLQDAIDEGYKAVEGVKKMKILANAVSERASKNKADYARLLESLDYQENLFTVLADYRSYFLHYFHWLDTGNDKSKKSWQSALNNYVANEKEHERKYAANLDFPAYNFREANVGADVSKHNMPSAWAARVLLLLVLAAMLAPLFVKQKQARQKFGINGLQALWTAIFNPAAIAHTTLSTTDKRSICIAMALIMVGGIDIFTSHSAPAFTLYLVVLTLLYGLQLWLFFGYKKSTTGFKSILPLASSLLIILPLLVIAAQRGPMQFWLLFWTSATFRLIFFSIFIFSLLWTYYVLFVSSTKAFGIGIFKTIAIILVIQGIQFVAGGLIVQLCGFEKTLTAFNDELLVLPGGLSRILGITTHLNIPVALPLWVMYAGIALLAIGAVLLLILPKPPTAND